VIRVAIFLVFILNLCLYPGNKTYYECRDNGFFFSANGNLWSEEAFFSGKKCLQFKESGSLLTVNTSEGIYYLNKSSISPFLLRSSKLSDDLIKEASGVSASGVNRGVYWTHNDSGDSAVVFAVGTKGEAFGRFVLKGCLPFDVEDIAVGPGPKPGRFYIYLADIGDNRRARNLKRIYRFLEPEINYKNRWQEITDYDVIEFRYPEHKKYDAETIVVDPFTNDLVIVTKRDRKSTEQFDRAFVLKYPQSVKGEVNKSHFLCNIIVPAGLFIGYGITGGDVSRDGRGLVLKTYTNVYYWQRLAGEPFSSFFKNKYSILPYNSQEGQGEALCFSSDGNYYLTIPEESISDAFLTTYILREWKKK
jgi:hypothetical protein